MSFFSNLLQRRLSSLLERWIQREPDLELKLGFRSSWVIARNLQLRVELLNELLEDTSPFHCQHVMIELLTVRFSALTAPAFSLEIRGLHVTLSPSGAEDGSSTGVSPSLEGGAREMRKALSSLDPEGCSLHDVLEMLLFPNSSKSHFRSSLLNLILGRCCIKVVDADLELQSPGTSDLLAYSLRIKELNAEPEDSACECLFVGIIQVIFAPLNENSLILGGSGFEFAYKRNGQVHHVFSANEISCWIKLYFLQLAHLALKVRESKTFLCPSDVPVFLKLEKLLSRQQMHVRSGRQLWNLVAFRISCLASTPRLLLQKTVGAGILWLRYVIAYESLLLLVNYSSERSLKSSIQMILGNKLHLQCVRAKWDMVTAIERELSVEAIAQARRVARHRALLNTECTNHRNEFQLRTLHHLLWIFSVFTYLWVAICRMFLSVKRYCFSTYRIHETEFDDRKSVVDYSCGAELQVTVNVSEVYVVIYPDHSIYPGKLKGEQSKINSFSLSVDKILLVYATEILERSLSFSCSELKINSSNLGSTAVGDDGTKAVAFGTHNKIHADILKTILQIEPVTPILISRRKTPAVAANCNGVRNVGKSLNELLSSWKRSCLKYEKKFGIEYAENPRILCEIKNFLRYRGDERQDTGFTKCSILFGKFNIVLEYGSISSIIHLVRQIQRFQDLLGKKESPGLLSRSPLINKERERGGWVEKYEFYADKIIVSLLRAIPQKYTELSMYIPGPHLEVSMEKCAERELMNYTSSQGELWLVFDLHDIELAICPVTYSDKVFKSDNAEVDHHSFQKLCKIDIPEPCSGKYVSHGWICLWIYLEFHGLKAFFCDEQGDQKSQIFECKSINLHFSSLRNYVYTFGLALTALSTALDGLATGLSITFRIDDLYALSQLIQNSLPVRLKCCKKLEDDLLHQELMGTISVEDDCGGAFPTRKTMIQRENIYAMDANFELKCVDVTLQHSRSIKLRDSLKTSADLSGVNSNFHQNLADFGVKFSLIQANLGINYEEWRSNFTIDLSELQSTLFKYYDYGQDSDDHIDLRNLPLSWNNLCEVSLSSCSFKMHVDRPRTSPASENDLFVCNDSSTVVDTPNARWNSSDRSILSSRGWIIGIDLAMSEVCMARSSTKRILMREPQSTRLLSSHFKTDFKSLYWKIQGGFCLLEPEALEMFLKVCSSYGDCIKSILSTTHSATKRAEPCSGTSVLNSCSEYEQISDSSKDMGLECRGSFVLYVSRFTIAFIGRDESGLRQFLVDVDVHTNLKQSDSQQIFLFELSHSSIFSQIFEDRANEMNVPHFSSFPLRGSSSICADLVETLPQSSGSRILNGAGFSEDCESWESAAKNIFPSENCQSYDSYILKNLVVLLSIHRRENSNSQSYNGWIGSGSVTGFELNISFSELKVILSMLSTFSGSYSGAATFNSPPAHWLSDHETASSETEIPDGAIVALQDVHQHSYFSVENQHNKFTLKGVLHYSLVGERGLFEIHYHKQRRWRSSLTWFSLTSLHAKNNEGKHLQLSYNPGSRLVDISETSGSASNLWRKVSCQSERYLDDIDSESYHQLAKYSFYLVNKKSDCGVAFVDGFPEFVGKPGNPFKLKQIHDNVLFSTIPDSVSDTQADNDEANTSVMFGSIPSISIAVEGISFTIFHELSVTKDRLPFFRGSLDIAQLIVQILPAKTRIMSSSTASVCYFDAQRNLWKNFIHPVGVNIFCRSSLPTQVSGISLSRMPFHIYFQAEKLNLSLTELSLDMLLFGIGKMDLAGPFQVKSSNILANCCKVENCSALDLLCSFNEKQTVTIGRKQFASIYLRLPASSGQWSEEASDVAIQLSLGKLTTSAILLSLLESRTLTWRTRIVSLQDQRSYPGPFIVVDTSKRFEDGLSMVVSPLTRIHNETEFSLDLRFQRPDQRQDEFPSVLLKPGDSVDDAMAAFDAVSLSGASKKALTSLALGNFIFSFRPETPHARLDFLSPILVEWSEEIKGGKAMPLLGIFEKLNYGIRSALYTESMKCSFSTAYCAIKSEESYLASIHFLVERSGRNVPIIDPEKLQLQRSQNSPIGLIEQKEIYILPTMRVLNLLSTEIDVLLSETDEPVSKGRYNDGKQATIKYGAKVDFYVNPAVIYFNVFLLAFGMSCKPVNSGKWVEKLHKNKKDARYLDIDLEFADKKCYAILRLSCGIRGVIEATVFSLYNLENDSDSTLLFIGPNQKPPTREEIYKMEGSIHPDRGLYLPPKSTQSWLLKSKKLWVQVLEDCDSKVLLDVGGLSGLSEMSLEIEDESGVKFIKKFGLSVKANPRDNFLTSQMVSISPRYIVINESQETVSIRQCYLEDDSKNMITINCGQGTVFHPCNGAYNRKEYRPFEKFIWKHGNHDANLLIFIQFMLEESSSAWSGPISITSIGQFFLKFRRKREKSTYKDNTAEEFASVTVAEEGSTLTVRFQKPPISSIPYRIENCLRQESLRYYQKDSSEAEILEPGRSAVYAWDDLSLPHKLVVMINDLLVLREIRLDKVRPWKPLFNVTQQRSLTAHPRQIRNSDSNTTDSKEKGLTEFVKFGFEVYAEGPTRVLRISEYLGYQNVYTRPYWHAKVQFRVSHLGIHLLEHQKLDSENVALPSFMPILVARLGNIGLDSLYTHKKNYNQFYLQSLNIDHKWEGAPFAAMLRRHQSHSLDANDCLLKVIFIVLVSRSTVTHVRYCSVILQPIDINLDEETLVRILPFWKTSLGKPSTPSRQFYFDHFEVHPIKVITNFLPSDAFTNYSSAQETLRTLLHSVIKVPPIKNMVVELNGVLVTHALITFRELLFRCARHYSWYAMRAIYIAKGSSLLPPTFASIFDDLASSSLDAFFDPSRGLTNFPGVTIGTFKLLRKCINRKGFSGTKRYFGDIGNTLRVAGSNVLFAAVAEISDSILRGAETKGINGVVSGFHRGLLKLAMEPSLLSTALLESGSDRTIKLKDRAGVDEFYVEGYIQAMLDTTYRQEFLRVKVIDDQVYLKNLPPNNTIINEIMDRVKEFLISRGLLEGDLSAVSRYHRHFQASREWKFGPAMLTLCEHLLVNYAIRILRKQANRFMRYTKPKKEGDNDNKAVSPLKTGRKNGKATIFGRLGIGNFVLSSIIAYMDGRLCRCIPNPVARRIVSGFLLSFLDKNDDKEG